MSQSLPAPHSRSSSTDSPTVLLVDDDADIVRGTQLRLKARGFRVITANGGRTCVTLAIEQKPDVILLDVRMPGQDGLETLSQLQDNETTRDIPVVMLSGSVTDETLALDNGARFFLRKPVVADSLLAAVQNVLTASPCVADAS